MKQISKMFRTFFIITSIMIALEIFLISSIQGSALPKTGLDFSTLYHLIAFFVFNSFMLISIIWNKKVTSKKIITVLVITLLYAATDELHQFFVPERTPDIIDFLTDATGIFISTSTYLLLNKYKKLKSILPF